MKKICALLVILMLFLLMGDIFIGKETSADTIYPEITVSSTQKTITAEKDKEFIIDYTFTPKSIPVSALNTTVDKEIILVIDTSGSMTDGLQNSNTTKITALIKAAKAFVKKFANEGKTKIGIVSYSTKGKITQGLIDAKNTSTLERKLDELSNVSGATNIGEGMRQALKELNKNTTAKKFVILMSDGEPTAFSYSESHQSEKYDSKTGAHNLPDSNYYKLSKGSSLFTSLTDSNTMKTGFYNGTSDPNSYAKNFAKDMAVIGKGKGVRSFAVGFVLQGNGANKLREIAAAGDGLYYNGNNESEIINIYEEIANKIIGEYIMVNNTITYSSLANLTYTGTEYQPVVQGNEVTLKLPDIKYTIDNSKTYYKADPFTISLKFKASNYGDYSLGAANLIFNYLDIEKKTKKLELPIVKINVPSPVEMLNLSRTIENSPDNTVPINSNFNMIYTINPTPIAPSQAEKKEIVLVIDTSNSMNASNKSGETKYKIDIIKDQAKALVNKFAGNPNVKFGIVIHGQKGEAKVIKDGLYLVGADRSEDIIKFIDGLRAESNDNNIGDGIRKGLALFTGDSTIEKNLIIITDGGNNYYTYKTGDWRIPVFFTEVTLLEESLKYSDGKALGILFIDPEDYYRDIAEVISKRGYPIKTTYIQLSGSNGDKTYNLLTSMKNKSGGAISDLRDNSESQVIETFNTIITGIGGGNFKITAPKLKVSSKSGFILNNNTAEYLFKDVEYKYNPISGKYEAPLQAIPVGYKATAIGNDGITLSGDASLAYKDLKGRAVDSRFPDMLIRVRDNTQIKLGLFSSTPIQGKPIGENYIDTQHINPEFVENIPIRMAAMIKNYGEGSNLKLTINKDLSRGIISVNINKSDVIVYRIVNDKLEPVAINSNDITITGSGSNSAVLNVKIPTGTASTENYYIVNYNFTSSISEAEDIQQEDKILTVYGEVIGSGKKDNYSVIPVLLPDVF